jgi:hypothetical protein
MESRTVTSQKEKMTQCFTTQTSSQQIATIYSEM